MSDSIKPKGPISGTVVMHCHFYRDQYKRVVLITLMALIITILCGLIIAYLALHKPSDVYLSAEDSQLRPESPAIANIAIVPHIPLYSPNNMPTGELTLWILNSIKSSFSYSLATYKEQLEANRAYYTPQGWNTYLTILNQLANFSNLTTKQTLISTVIPKAAPTIFEEKTVDGVYTWTIDIPIQVRFNGTVNIPWAELNIRLTIIRTPMNDDVYGVKIDHVQVLSIKRGSTTGKSLIFS